MARRRSTVWAAAQDPELLVALKGAFDDTTPLTFRQQKLIADWVWAVVMRGPEHPVHRSTLAKVERAVGGIFTRAELKHMWKGTRGAYVVAVKEDWQPLPHRWLLIPKWPKLSEEQLRRWGDS
jgi:hypothetical protein